MKKISLFLALVSLSLTAVSAQASLHQDQPVVELGSFEVRASRHSEAEKSIESSLASLRAQARQVETIRTELPSFGTVATQPVDQGSARQLAAKPATLLTVRS